MAKIKRILLAVLFLSFASPAFAEATFEEAVSLFEDKNFEEARTIAEPLASADDPRAMAMMGAFYQKGLGVAVDMAAAKMWFQKAADKNHPGAQFSLAMMLLDNSLAENDPEAAAVVLEKAATGGNVQAQYNLGLVYAGRYGTPPDWKKAALWFRKAADQNDPEAQYNLGLLFLDGNGVEKDQVAAADWLSRAAVKGMPEAALEYGVLVMRGEGVQRDEKIGLKWLLYAANRGHPVAQNRLARIYAAGVGSISANSVEAAKWNIIASASGRPDATLDDMMKKLTPQQKAQAEQEAAQFQPAEAPAAQP
jgi:uncharacterized protein